MPALKRWVLFHHAPERTDDQIDALLAHHRKNTPDLQLIAASEGLELRLPDQAAAAPSIAKLVGSPK